MQAEVILALEAEHGSRRQFCKVEMGQDFFGAWVIVLRRGIAGRAGRRQVFSAASLERAWEIVMGRLLRYQTECLRKGARALALVAIPDMSIPAWASAPLLPWSRLTLLPA